MPEPAGSFRPATAGDKPASPAPPRSQIITRGQATPTNQATIAGPRDSSGSPPPRALLVARRFWPLCDDAAGRVCTLAEGLRRSGLQPTILSARYSNQWPTELTFREVEVLRPVSAPRGDWTTGIYQRALHRWLQDHASNYDILYSDSMREEGAAVVEVADSMGIPSVVRCGGNGASADWLQATSSRGARRLFNTSMRAKRVIVSSAGAMRALVACGAQKEILERIADGVPPAIRRERADCDAARASLAAVNSDLRTAPDDQIVVVMGRFESGNGTMQVAKAIAPLCGAKPNLRVWFIGDGPIRDALHQFLKDSGVRDHAALPGSFWHIEEIVRAADMMIFPAENDSFEHRLPLAISAAIPSLIVSKPETAQFFAELRGSDISPPTFNVDDIAQARSSIRTMLDSMIESKERAIQLRNIMRRKVPREHSIDAHHRLFISLIGRETTGQSRGNGEPSS